MVEKLMGYNSTPPFLICGIRRSGTTYILSSLGKLSDVYADFELVCFPTNFAVSEFHVSLPLGYQAARFLNSLTDDFGIAGSKLLMGFPTILLHNLSSLNVYINSFDGVNIIHIVRDYFDLIVSGTHSFMHDVQQGDNSGMLSRIKKANESKKLKPNNLQFNSINKSLFDFLISDMIICSIAAQNNSILVEYTEASGSIGKLAEFIGSRATKNEIKTIVDNPTTAPTRHGDPARLERVEEVRENAAKAMRLRDAFIRAGDPIEKWLSSKNGKVFITPPV